MMKRYKSDPINMLWAGMYQGGESGLQPDCGGFDMIRDGPLLKIINISTVDGIDNPRKKTVSLITKFPPRPFW